MVENKKKKINNCFEYRKYFFGAFMKMCFTKMSNMLFATAQNIKNMNMGPILRHTTLYPPHPDIEFSPWKCVNSANTSLQNLYYKISCYFRIGQNFHISTHFYNFTRSAKCTSGYRLQLLINFLISFQTIYSTFLKWRIVRKVIKSCRRYLKYISPA